jgi:hypothetical protein
MYHNRGVLLSSIAAGFLSTSRKKLLIGFHLLLVTTMGLQQGLQTAFLRTQLSPRNFRLHDIVRL